MLGAPGAVRANFSDMEEPSRAEQVLAAVVNRFPAPSDDNGHLRLVGAWTDGPDTVCVVYEGWWQSWREYR